MAFSFILSLNQYNVYETGFIVGKVIIRLYVHSIEHWPFLTPDGQVRNV
jgi:hypothetical protein